MKLAAVPAIGKVSAQRRALERSPGSRWAWRWRAGIEGRINCLQDDATTACDAVPIMAWMGSDAGPAGSRLTA